MTLDDYLKDKLTTLNELRTQMVEANISTLEVDQKIQAIRQLFIEAGISIE